MKLLIEKGKYHEFMNSNVLERDHRLTDVELGGIMLVSTIDRPYL